MPVNRIPKTQIVKAKQIKAALKYTICLFYDFVLADSAPAIGPAAPKLPDRCFSIGKTSEELRLIARSGNVRDNPPRTAVFRPSPIAGSIIPNIA